MCGQKRYGICFPCWHQLLELKAAKSRDLFLSLIVIPSLCSMALRTTTKLFLIPFISLSFLVHPMPTFITTTGTLQRDQLPPLTQTVPCSYFPFISSLFQPHHFNSCFSDLVLFRFGSGGQSHLSLPLTSMRAEVLWPFRQTLCLSTSSWRHFDGQKEQKRVSPT